MDKRIEVLANFENGLIDVIICSDLAARGLDIADVERIVSKNFKLKKINNF